MNPRRKVALIRIEGTILREEEWRKDGQSGHVIPGAVEAIEELQRMGYRIFVFSSVMENDEAKKWLDHAKGTSEKSVVPVKVPYDKIGYIKNPTVVFDCRTVSYLISEFSWRDMMRKFRRYVSIFEEGHTFAEEPSAAKDRQMFLHCALPVTTQRPSASKGK